MLIPCKFNCNPLNQCTSNANPSPCPSVWRLVGISKHWRENSTLLAYNQKPQPQLGPNVQALRRGLRQNLQPWGWAGPPGLVLHSDWMPAILNFLACAWKFRLAPKIPLCKFNTTSMKNQCQFNANSVQSPCTNNGKVKATPKEIRCKFNWDSMQIQCTYNAHSRR